MNLGLNIITTLVCFGLTTSYLYAQQTKYEPNWDELDKRPIPPWYDDAKFGIFIHWGVYSVPAWAPKTQYAEWYWHSMNNILGKETLQYHIRTYGKKFRYQDFASMFKAELFDPKEWAELFKESGAKYVVLTSKHHDGFCLFPSKYSWNWNSVDIGPHRDLVGDLAKATLESGLKFGLYYSLYEWFNPLYLHHLDEYVDHHMLPQLKEIVENYRPSLIFADGEWDHPSDVWKSKNFLAWLYNESPVKDEVVVNDRWGKETRTEHGGYFTSEYGGFLAPGKTIGEHKWEENQGIGRSFGFNRNENAQDYKTSTQLIHMLIDIVSRGGNLLLDIGPTADGKIPVIMQERLLEIGEWLKINGEAIYDTKPWRETSDGENIKYTTKGNILYAICLKLQGKELVLNAPKPTDATVITMLGYADKLKWKTKDGKIHIEIPSISVNELPTRNGCVFKLTGVK